MKAIRKRVDQSAEIVDLPLTLANMQREVGGYVQMVPIGPGIDIVCNEDGMSLGLPENTAGYLGHILVVAVDPVEGDCRGLTDEECRKALAYLEQLKDLKHPGGAGFGIITGAGAVEQHLTEASRDRQSFWESL